MSAPATERRSETRRSVSLPNGIEIRVPTADGRARAIMAQLVDASDGGLGVETFSQLETGSTVEVQADLSGSEISLAFGGTARVAYARELSPGRYHVGLELRDVRFAKAS